MLNQLWLLSAGLAVVAVFLEIAHQHCDDRDFEKLESDLEDARRSERESKTLAEKADRRSAVLEENQSQRRLNPDQAKAIKNVLSDPSYTGHKFEIWVATGDSESAIYANDLCYIFMSSGWSSAVSPLGGNSAIRRWDPLSQPPGLMISINGTVRPPREIPESAARLLSAFKGCGIDCLDTLVVSSKAPKPGLQIHIGPKRRSEPLS